MIQERKPLLEKILVPVDGSELSERILSQVHRLLVRRDAEVVIVRVLPPEVMVYTTPQDPLDTARAEVDRLVQALRSHGANARGEVLVGDPAARILEFGQEERASLVALATHGRSGIARWIRGSTAERLLRASTVPLLLANPRGIAGADAIRFRRILVPLDGSERSAEVLPFVREIAQLYGSEIVLQFVIEVVPSEYPAAATYLSEDEARRLLEPAARALSGMNVRIEIDRGAAAYKILHRAEQERADLVALATHGRTGARRWAFGSVAEDVLRHVGCPLLAVRTVPALEGEPLAATAAAKAPAR